MSTALSVGIAAAQAADRAGFAAATELLRRQDPAQIGVAQAATIRAMLEQRFPSGLDGEDIRAVLTDCVRSSTAWLPDVDVTALIAVLTSALGMAEPDDLPRLDPNVLTLHGCLVIADLATGLAEGAEPYMQLALAEIERAETIEMP